MANNIYTQFNATTTPATVVPARPARRALRIQVYGPPDVTSGITVWVNTTGIAVANQGWQCISGAVWEWGLMAPREFSHPGATVLPNCPIGAISVVTSSGTAAGVIEEII